MKHAADKENLARAFLALAALAALVPLVCAGAALAQEPAAAPAAPQQVPSLAGRWELNAQESDSPRGDVAVPASRGGTDGFGGFGGYGGGGTTGVTGGGYRGGGAGGAGTRGGGSTLAPATRDEIQRVLAAPRVLLIVQDDSHLTLTDEDGRVVSLKPDGAKVQEQHAGMPMERTTKWDGRSLVTTMKLKGGVKVAQTFTKASEGLQLVVFTKVEGGGLSRPIELKRVYDQAFQDRVAGPSASR
jgi:hypothetical protein